LTKGWALSEQRDKQMKVSRQMCTLFIIIIITISIIEINHHESPPPQTTSPTPPTPPPPSFIIRIINLKIVLLFQFQFYLLTSTIQI
jgi:hypothetical protein